MPYYLFQWKYKDPAFKAMMETSQDRPAELRKAVEAFGGRMHEFYFAFGEFDGVSIVEFPNNKSCAACAVTLSGAGANTNDRIAHPERRAGSYAAGEFGSSRLSIAHWLR